MLIANLISNMLVSGDFSNYFSKLPSALESPEPIVVAEGPFERESRIDGEERGCVPVTVMVVRDVSADAESVAIAAELWLRSCDWERNGEAGYWRIVGIDTSAPFLKVRDSSGRYVWQFGVNVKVVREI